MIKNQELKDLSNTFDEESKRLNGIINKKDEYINNVSSQLNEEK